MAFNRPAIRWLLIVLAMSLHVGKAQAQLQSKAQLGLTPRMQPSDTQGVTTHYRAGRRWLVPSVIVGGIGAFLCGAFAAGLNEGPGDAGAAFQGAAVCGIAGFVLTALIIGPEHRSSEQPLHSHYAVERGEGFYPPEQARQSRRRGFPGTGVSAPR